MERELLKRIDLLTRLSGHLRLYDHLTFESARNVLLAVNSEIARDALEIAQSNTPDERSESPINNSI